MRTASVQVLLLASCAWLLACDSQPTTTATRGVVRGAAPSSGAGEDEMRRRRTGSPFDDEGEGGEQRDDGTAQQDDMEQAAPPAPESELVIDLAGRVRRAFGFPTHCLTPDSVSSGVAEIDVGVDVVVSAQGFVTRANVSAPGVAAPARQCLLDRAAAMRLPLPIPDAPATVHASVRLGVPTPPPPPTVAAAQPRVLPAGARPADAVLPAQAGTGPAAGSVAPGVTLPAQAGTGPAAGSVAAGVTLPAQGGQGTVWISGSAEARGEVD